MIISRAFRHVLDFLFPTACAYCKSPVGDSSVPFFCSSCWSDFTPITSPVCPSCGRPFDSPEALRHSPEHCCSVCRRNPPVFDQVVSVGLFEGSLREAIHQFKYRPCRALGKPLAGWMNGNIRLVSDIAWIIPVPLHPSRLRFRGFNQSLILAHELGKAFAVPLSYDNLIRIRATKPQVELSGEDRIKNVANAFLVQRPGEIEGKEILLVDDVFTTGATMNECSLVLKEAGASRVTGITIARAD